MTAERAALPVSATLREALALTRHAAWRGGLYILSIQAVGAVALSPLATWLFYVGLRQSAAPVLTNYELLDVILDWRTLPLRALWILVVGATAGVQLGGSALVITAVRRGKTLTVVGTLRRVAVAVPLIFDRGLVKLGLFAAILFPLSAIAWSTFVAIVYSPFEQSAVTRLLPQGKMLAAIVAVCLALAAVGFFLLVRWGFTLQALVVDRLPLRNAIARSTELARSNFRSVAVLRAASMAVVAIAYSLSAATLAIASGALLGAMGGEPGQLQMLAAAFLVALQAIVLALLALLSLIWRNAVTVVAYDRLCGRLGTPGRRDAALARDESAAERKRRRFVQIGAVLFVAGATLLSVPKIVEQLQRADEPVAIIAHRGSSGRAPENTLAAIRAALEDGANYIEIDVQEAQDGELVLMHDLTLQRVAGRHESVFELTSKELASVDVGRWFDASFAGEGVPTLSDVIAEVRGKARLMIEVKVHGKERDVVGTLLGLLERESFEDQCFVASLDRGLLTQVRARAPHLELGLILSAAIGDPHAIDVEHLCVQPLMPTIQFVNAVHARGRFVHVWTLNERSDLQEFVDRGVDGVITDEPALAAQLLAERTPEDDARAALARLFAK